jgi:hypothetical protein
MCVKKKDVSRLRKAKKECGCSSLQEFLLLAIQTKSAPRKFNPEEAMHLMRRLEVGEKVGQDCEIPRFALAFADEVLARKDFASSLKSLRFATQSSGRVLMTT